MNYVFLILGFREISFSNCLHDLLAIRIVRDQKTILLHAEKPRFMFSIDFEFLKVFSFSYLLSPSRVVFGFFVPSRAPLV